MAMEEYDPTDINLDVHAILKNRVKTRKIVDLSKSDYHVPLPQGVTHYSPIKDQFKIGEKWYDAHRVPIHQLIILMCHVLSALGKNYMIEGELKP